MSPGAVVLWEGQIVEAFCSQPVGGGMESWPGRDVVFLG